MHICLECGCVFEDHKQYESEQLEYFGFPCRDTWQGCPNCSSGSTVKTIKCEICYEYIDDEYYEVGDMKVCESCCTKKTLKGGL